MKFNAPKGMQDILPPEIAIWQHVESAAREVFSLYGYQEIRLPVVESTDVFTRSIGETTDIVEKEMYTFLDRAGRSITLRPEGTAPAVRCYIEHHLHTLPSPQKFYYTGPMFRYERPQKGRFRQFYQIGAEAFGVAEASLDAEMITMLQRLLERIGIEGISFEINSIGCEECRPAFKQALLGYFRDLLPQLCPDCQRRYGTNPLRILDCKVDRCVELRKGAPSIQDHLCPDCRCHFDDVLRRLRLLGITHVVNPNLVRGLDYYTRTTFEVTSEHLGAQKAVSAGGRYDGLVGEFGGAPTPAIGFAMGMERITALLKEKTCIDGPGPAVFVATLGEDAGIEGLRIAEELRKAGHRVEPNYGGASLKSQLRKADRLGAAYALIIGDEELKAGMIKWKHLKKGEQGEVPFSSLLSLIGEGGR